MSRALDDKEQEAFLKKWEKMQEEIDRVRTAHKDGAISLVTMCVLIRQIRRRYKG